jgi:hypothetical protein
MALITCVYDEKAEEFTPNLIVVQNLAVAARMFSDVVNDSNSMFHKHADDFTLKLLGEFDPAVGLITVYNQYQVVIAAAEVLRRAAPRENPAQIELEVN